MPAPPQIKATLPALPSWLPERQLRPWAIPVLLILGLVFGVVPPLYGLAAVAGVAVFVVVLVRPAIGLYLLAVSVPFQTLRGADPTQVQITITEVLIGLTLGAFLLRQFAIERGSWRTGPLVLPLSLFLGAMVLSVLKATNQLQSLKELVKWLELLAAYWMALNLLKERRAVAAFLIVSTLAALAEVAIGAAQVVLRIGPAAFLIGGRILRAYGTFGQPNPFAGYLNMTLPVLLGVALFTPNRALRFWSGTAAVGMGLVMITTLSRGAWLGFALALVVMGVAMSRRVAVWVWLALFAGALIVLAAVFGVIPFGISSRVLAAFGLSGVSLDNVTAENFSAVQRLAFWQAGLNMFEANPVLGVGIGNYIQAYPAYAAQGWEQVLGHAHDYYLNAAAETGIVGLSAYLILLGASFRELGRTVRSLHGGVWAGVAIGLLGMLTAISTHNLVDNMYVHGMPVLLGLLLGVASSLRRSASASELTGADETLKMAAASSTRAA